jgi:hypothetical protein
MAPVRYDLAVASWRASEVITIVSRTGNPIAYFPLDFIVHGGHPEWTYVLLVIQQITDQAVNTQWRLEEQDSQPVSLQGVPRAGKYVYQCQGKHQGMRADINGHILSA